MRTLKIKNYLNKMIPAILAAGLMLAITGFIPTKAQTNPCSQTAPQRAQGLVSAPLLSGKFFTGGGCIIDPKAAFVPSYTSFADFKSLYYDQSKVTKNTITTLGTGTSFTTDAVYYDSGDLTLSGNPTGTATAVIFVNGNLNINANYTYGSAQSGTVFVVHGNVNIDNTVTRVDAIILAEGVICTATTSGSCPSDNVLSTQLVINGSLISLNDANPPKFRRTLAMADNFTQPAEKVNHQVKYLVILRNLISDTFQKWSEIDSSVSIPSPFPH